MSGSNDSETTRGDLSKNGKVYVNVDELNNCLGV